MLKKAAMVVGAVFLLLGIGGFIPFLTTTDAEGHTLALGLFEVDAVHNLVHILSGLVFLAASAKAAWSRLAFQVFGVVYAIVTLVGFLTPDGNEILGLFAGNLADDFLHLILTAAFLYLGFGTPKDRHDTL